MRRRTKIILVLGTVVLLALGWVVFKPEKEPEYNGKKLSEWVIQLEFDANRHHPSAGLVEEANVAIRSIGTNAIPFLLKWIDYQWIGCQEPNWITEGSDRLQKFIKDIGLTWEIRPSRHAILNFAVPGAFAALGPMADSATPALAKLFYQRVQNGYAIAFALGSLGTNGCRELVSALTNTNVIIRRYAAESLRLSTNAANAFAIPALLASLHDSDDEVARYAAGARLFKLQPDLAIPPLIGVLNEQRTNVQRSAIYALGRFGPQASKALPALLPFLNSRDANARENATNAIRKIDPNALP